MPSSLLRKLDTGKKSASLVFLPASVSFNPGARGKKFVEKGREGDKRYFSLGHSVPNLGEGSVGEREKFLPGAKIPLLTLSSSSSLPSNLSSPLCSPLWKVSFFC